MLPTGVPNIPAFMIAEHFQMLGPNATISTACATGTQAIGEATEFIRHGAADLVITGGVEALMHGLGDRRVLRHAGAAAQLQR